jgi:hypothetical protein
MATAVFKEESKEKWEDTPIAFSEVCRDEEDANKCAQRHANDTGKKVRWNWAGGLQGHYKEPNNG